MKYVIDENVLVVANGRETHAGGDCEMACIDFLLQCSRDESLVLDDLGRVLALYASKCNWSGQPGVGDQFFLWAHSNAHAISRVALSLDESGDYAALPDELAEFDSDDLIYLALALESREQTQLVNAVDSDYNQARDQVTAGGVEVLELCLEELKH